MRLRSRKLAHGVQSAERRFAQSPSNTKASGHLLQTHTWSLQMIMRMLSRLMTIAFSLTRMAVGYGVLTCASGWVRRWPCRR